MNFAISPFGFSSSRNLSRSEYVLVGGRRRIEKIGSMNNMGYNPRNLEIKYFDLKNVKLDKHYHYITLLP